MIDRIIDRIIIHCSDSKFGNAIKIDEWHKFNKWEGCGYHYVICNGYTFDTEDYDSLMDGSVESGRSLAKAGAHCYGYNDTSIGICLVGKSGHFTPNQYQSLVDIIKNIKRVHGQLEISMHSDLNPQKPSCPGVTTSELLELLTNV